MKWQFPAGWDKVGNMRRPGTGGWPQHFSLLCTHATPHRSVGCTYAMYTQAVPGPVVQLERYMATLLALRPSGL